MKVTVAKSAGFCYGVERAVALARETARTRGGAMLGSIIHNDGVVAELEVLGMRRVSSPDEVRAGEAVLIRSHGEPRGVLEELEARDAELVDATCPNVRRTQRLVEEAAREGRRVVVIGEARHPEVAGIVSRCEGAVVCGDAEAARSWLESGARPVDTPVLVVAQTTCVRTVWEKCLKILKKECTNLKVCDTICNATQRRQSEAAALAAEVDAMVVVGDRKSANTRHLTEICKEVCPRVVQVETADELSPDVFIGCIAAGLTAGASTPASIIKEVYATMTEEIKTEGSAIEELREAEARSGEAMAEKLEEAAEKVKAAAAEFKEAAIENGEAVAEKVGAAREAAAAKAEEAAEKAEEAKEAVAEKAAELKEAAAERAAEAKEAVGAKAAEGAESFEELLEKSFKTLNTGDKVTGTVTSIGSTEIQVDLGCKQAGYIPISELSNDPDAKVEDIVHVGDEIETYIVRVNDAEGYATLSKKRLDAVKVWENIEEAVANKTVLEGTVTEVNKGGLVVFVKGVRVFVPASQSGQPRDTDLAAMIKQNVKLRVTEVNRARRRVVGSIRSVLSEARQAAQAEVWNNIGVGKRYKGTVKSMTSYGVFVDIGGVDGMVHISELSWSRIKHPSEVVSVGDTLDVYVISFDPEKRKISLGVKDRTQNPWDVFMKTYQVGDVASVRIVKLMTFGAFAEVVPGVDGLIHISQIADRRIDKPSDVLAEGDKVDVRITAIDEDRKKISLSIRALLDSAPAANDAGKEALAEE